MRKHIERPIDSHLIPQGDNANTPQNKCLSFTNGEPPPRRLKINAFRSRTVNRLLDIYEKKICPPKKINQTLCKYPLKISPNRQTIRSKNFLPRPPPLHSMARSPPPNKSYRYFSLFMEDTTKHCKIDVPKLNKNK